MDSNTLLASAAVLAQVRWALPDGAADYAVIVAALSVVYVRRMLRVGEEA